MRLSRRALLLSAASLPVLHAQTPRPAPEFSVNLPDGNKLPLKAFRGKTVVLAFISTS